MAEHPLDRTLRWMRANLSGALNAKYPAGHSAAGDHCTNSGTGTLICCYIDALGKVLCRGASGNRRHFAAFLTQCMEPFLTARSTKALPDIPGKGRGAGDGEAWLYEVYRCGFVHQFVPFGAGWRRSATSHRIWTSADGVTLTIDALAREFEHGLVRFEAVVRANPKLLGNFDDYLSK